jgi:hypothetical protein
VEKKDCSAFRTESGIQEEIMFDGDNNFSDEFDWALMAFFKPPALSFSRKLRTGLDEDPNYLERHESDVLPQLQKILRDAGVPVDEKTSVEQMRHVVREVVVRLRTYERGTE